MRSMFSLLPLSCGAFHDSSAHSPRRSVLYRRQLGEHAAEAAYPQGVPSLSLVKGPRVAFVICLRREYKMTFIINGFRLLTLAEVV